LASYGPEATECRVRLRDLVVVGLDRIWPGEASRQVDLRPKETSRDSYNQLQALAPKNESQSATKSEVISMASKLILQL